jgi:DNA-binding GntR family transcriptional regulator
MSVEALSKPHRMQEVPNEHAIVVEAMRSGRVEEATEAMRRHMDWSKRAVLERHRAAAGALDPEPAPATGSRPSPARA